MLGGGAVIFKVTLTVWGVLLAPVAETVIDFVYVPTERLALLTKAVSVAFPVPLPGLTDNHAGAVPSAVAVHVSVPPPPLERAIVWFAGLLPWTALKVRLVGPRTMLGGGAVTLRVTLTVWGVLLAPVAETVIDFV